MTDATIQQQITTANEPRKWIAAIVGGVILGEALWSMLQILVRDWATPALQNALGQGPTHNQGAFEPLPLVVAFVEACLAAILLVLFMSLAQRRVRVVVRTVPASSIAAQAPLAASRVSVPAVPVASSVRAEAATPVVPVPQVQRPVTAATPNFAPVSAPAAAAPIASTPIERPVEPAPTRIAQQAVAAPTPPPQAVTPAPPQPNPAAVKPAPPKKPKTIYYNSVGEPIEE